MRRSRHLLGDVPAHFAYYEVMSCGGGAVGLAIALASSLGYALCTPLLLLPPVRWLLTKCVPPGLGPSPLMQACPNPNPNPNPNPRPNPNPNPNPNPHPNPNPKPNPNGPSMQAAGRWRCEVAADGDPKP